MFHRKSFTTPRLSDSSSSQQKTSRPPVHNPYDKFSQSEFDAWVGDLTSTLRQALGHEDDPPAQEEAEDPLDRLLDSFTEDHLRKEKESEEEVSDSDSSSETRDAFRKGKNWEQPEGSGLASGTYDEPIELDLDSDEEQDEQDEIVADVVQHEEDGGNSEAEDEDEFAEWDEEGDSDQENVAPLGAGDHTAYGDEDVLEQYDELVEDEDEVEDAVADMENEEEDELSQQAIEILSDPDDGDENEGNIHNVMDENPFFDEENDSFEEGGGAP